MHLIKRPWRLKEKETASCHIDNSSGINIYVENRDLLNKVSDSYSLDDSINDLYSRLININKESRKFIYNILIEKGYTTFKEQEQFLSTVSETDYHLDPFDMYGMEEIAERLNEAIKNDEKIILHGDYDLDGLSSSALVYKYFKKRGSILEIFIPSRIDDGYGITDASIKFIEARQADLVLTVDCGITAIDECKLLKDCGLEVCITDHHMPRDILPDTKYIIDPQMRENENRYENRDLAGVGVALKLIQAMEVLHLNKKGSQEASKIVARIAQEYADLVCLGTVADLMYMTRENTSLVRMGIEKIRKNEACMGIQTFLKVKNINCEDLDSVKLSVQVCPSFNAAGRISDVYYALALLLCENETEAINGAKLLNELNNKRRVLGDYASLQAHEKIRDHMEEMNGQFLCLELDDCHPGVLGIVASKISDYYAQPTLLFIEDKIETEEIASCDINGEEEDKTIKDNKVDDCCQLEKSTDSLLRGSARTFQDLNFYDRILKSAHYLDKFGGHQQAFGAEIYRSKLEEFKKSVLSMINEYTKGEIDSNHFTLTYDYKIDNQELKISNAEALNIFEPIGRGREAMIFRCDGLIISSARVVGGKKEHLQLKLSLPQNKNKKSWRERYRNNYIEAIAFNMGELEKLCREGRKIDILFSMHVNNYMSTKRLQLQIKDIHFCGDSDIDSSPFTKERSTSVQKITALYTLFNSCGSKDKSCGFYVNIRDIKEIFWKVICPARINSDISEEQLEMIFEILQELGLIKYKNLSENIKFVIVCDNNKRSKLSNTQSYHKYKEALEQ